MNKPEDILAALKAGTRRVAVHSEDEDRLIARKHLAERGKPETHPVWRDAEAARMSTERVLRLARDAGRRLHVLHVTTGDEIPLLAAAKDIATAETTPQHLTLSAPECYERLGHLCADESADPRRKPSPGAVGRRCAKGVIDVIGSDHAPHTREEKDKTYPDTPSGMPGVQTLVTILLDHVNEGSLTLERFVDLTSLPAPQRIFGIAGKGRIARGYDADFTIVDLGLTRTIENNWIASRCGWTPFDGMKTKGWAGRHHPARQDRDARFCRHRSCSRPAAALCGNAGTGNDRSLSRSFGRGDGPDRGGADRSGQPDLHPAHLCLRRRSTASSPAWARRWATASSPPSPALA